MTTTTHKILETHIDVLGHQFVATVGLWPNFSEGDPWETVAVVFYVPVWLPEYGTRADEFLASSPEWGGIGPARPSPKHLWAPIEGEWHLTEQALQQTKDEKWLEVKAARSRADWGGLVWDSSVFDSNPVSQQRISEFAARASRNPTFEIEWVLADNTTRLLGAADMLAVDAALGAQLATHAARAQVLRNAISAAATMDAVQAIYWSEQ